jgi:SSS family solute:Na+ symporter
MSSASSDAVAGVTTLVRDLYKLVFGSMPQAGRVVFISRIAIGLTTGLALAMALVADNVIGYIKVMIPLFISGMCVCGILGRLWKRYNAAGAIASLLGACGTSTAVMLVPEWEAYWEGEPVIPSILIATAAGVLVSLLTSPEKLSREEAIALLTKERETMEN